jgi:type I restriction-modification system DNA methylase subunit
MVQKYKCGICDSKPDQLSHHKMHINTQKHKDKRTIFELKLQSMTNEALVEKYKTYNINDIINKIETKKIMKLRIKEKTEMDSKKTISGNTIWNLEINQDLNPNYASIKSKLDSVIKRCHDLLYGKGGSIVGTKAQNDSMKILCLKILQSQFNDENSELWDRCNKVKSDGNMSDTQFNRFKTYCNDITEITKKDDVFKEWRIFVNKFLIKVFPSIYYENDNKFHCDKSPCIIELIKIIDSLDIDDEFKDAFSTTCGDIHESFRAYGGKNSGAKALGQFFTPRHLIHLMFHGIGLDKLIEPMEDITIYDPCMGTGGFLTRLFKMCNIPSENIYGCETEIDTIKFGEMSMVLTTGNSRNNIIKCDSLSACENPYILSKKFKAIVTNPPFSTKQDYKLLKENFNKTYPDSLVKFEEIYPLEIGGKPGGTCLFIQHCVYMLEEGGFCVIVLPDGEIFEGIRKKIKQFREWFLQKINIRTILKVPNGVFEHASVSTNVIVFTKNGATQNINFMETNLECNVVKDMFTISAQELKNTGYSLNYKDYVKEDSDNYDVPMVALGEICDNIQGGQAIKKENRTGGEFPYYGANGHIENSFMNKALFDGKYIICAQDGSIGAVHKVNGKFWPNNHTHILTINDDTKYEYIYYNLKYCVDYSKVTTGQIPKLNQQNLKEKIKILLPSLEVQQQIVDELSQIETSIETIESRIAQLKLEKDQYKKYGRKAEIRELLKDSEEKMLGELITCTRGNLGKPNEDTSKNIYPYYSGKTISGNLDNYVFEGPKIMLNYRINTKTDIFNICKYIDGGKYNCSRFSWVLTLNSEIIDLKYLYHYLENLVNYTPIITGSIPEINSTNLKGKIKIKIPTQEVQQHCIALFEEKEKFIQSIDEKINSEKEYITHLKQMAKDVISSFC